MTPGGGMAVNNVKSGIVEDDSFFFDIGKEVSSFF
jgi:hypothetical protein